MLKKIIIITIVILTSNIFSQNNFSIGFSGGIVSPNILATRTGKYGVGYNLNLNYDFSKKITIYIGTGELIYGKYSPKIHNVSLISILLGSKYYIYNGLISPFVVLEVSKNFGDIFPGFPKLIDGRPVGEKLYDENIKFVLSEFGISGGLGMSNEITECVSIELFYIMGIYSEDDNTFYSRLFIGFNYAF